MKRNVILDHDVVRMMENRLGYRGLNGERADLTCLTDNEWNEYSRQTRPTPPQERLDRAEAGRRSRARPRG